MDAEQPKEKSPLVVKLEGIFTIDGKGRPEKCKQLLELLRTTPHNELWAEIENMSKRKFV